MGRLFNAIFCTVASIAFFLADSPIEGSIFMATAFIINSL
jgi:hypothetical protein